MALAALSLGLLLALGGPLLLRDPSPRAPARGSTSAALTSSALGQRPLARASEDSATSPQGQDARNEAGTDSHQVGAQADHAGSAQAEPGARATARQDRADPRLRRRGTVARAQREASEEALGAAGGARLSFGLACGTYGASAHVPLRLERTADAPPARRAAWELRHDARLEVEALSAGSASREAGASLSYQILGPGRVRVRVVGKRLLGTGELCVIRLRVPSTKAEAPLPAYLPLEAIALRLDERGPRPGAGARGALRLEQ